MTSAPHHQQPASTFKPLSSILVKPAGPDCNMACRYCFYLRKCELFGSGRHRMGEPVLDAMIRQVMQDGAQNVNFGWQGGEPTLMGLDFFKKAVQLQQRYGRDGQAVGNGLQTNGILLDPEWADFMAQYHFLVGLSIDGPAHVHDHDRRLQGGQPSHDRVARVARMLLERRVDTNALTVVSDYSAQYPEDIYDFHRSIGLDHMQFIPVVEPDFDHPGRAAPFSVSPGVLGEFFCRIFDRWRRDFRNGWPTTSVRMFDSIFYTYVGLPAPECDLLPECGIYTVVEHNGDVYSCDFFVDPEWRLGNVLSDDLIEMLNSPRQNAFGHRKAERPPECEDCPWLTHCWGGCPKDRLHDPRDGGSNHFCGAYKMFFEHADPFFRELADKWQAQQQQARRQQQTGTQPTANRPRPGRNAPCPCGSGKKYKHCCARRRS